MHVIKGQEIQLLSGHVKEDMLRYCTDDMRECVFSFTFSYAIVIHELLSSHLEWLTVIDELSLIFLSSRTSVIVKSSVSYF